ncbi:MAG TPA: LegC family aminotransferase [Fermentimonas sp.]|nr:LegC family aminotransferase [Fermentimonas sp.]
MTEYRKIIEFIRSLYPDKDVIPLHEPYFAGNEKKYLQDCINSTYVSSVGKYVNRFEEMICEFTGAKYAVATVNGTAALHIALLLAGVKRGDLVITQPLTFIATCNAISYCGADPVFVDVDEQTLGMSPDSLEKWLSANKIIKEVDGLKACFYDPEKNKDEVHRYTQINTDKKRFEKNNNSFSNDLCSSVSIRGERRITACLPVHTFGHPCKIDKIVEICNRYHIPVVEDAAESIGSYYKEQHTGTFGLSGILSFNGNKTITTGGGGIIITNNKALATKAKHLTTQAKKPHPWKFEHDRIGYNYRLPNINAALGCAQMEILPEILENKRELAERYRIYFADLDKVKYVNEPENCRSNFWLNAVILENEKERDDFLKQSNENRVMTRPAWTLMHRLEMFKDSISADITAAEETESSLVNIPSSVRY